MGLDIGNLAGDNLPAFIMALAFGVMIIGIGTWAIGALNDNTDNPTSDLWTSTNNILTPTNLSDYIMTNNSLIFNNDSNYGYLSFNNITDNRYWNLPDKNGILATLNDINFNILKDSNNLILADGVHSEKVLPDMNLSPEVLTDTSFESWGLRYVPDNWDSENGNPIRLTGLDVRTGTYALGIPTEVRTYQTITGLTSGHAVLLDGYAKTSVSGTLVLFFSYQDGAISKYFNFTGVDAGTWTASPNPDGGPGADQINIWNSLTSSYTQLTVGGSVTLESTTISIGFSAQIGQVDLDDLTLTDINTSINVLSNGDFEDWNAYDDLNDYYDTFMRNIETITSLLVKESTPVNVHSGTYSAKLVSGADDIDVSLHILQAFYNNDDNGIDGQKVKISIFSKAGTGSGMIVLVNKDIRTDNDGQLLYNFSGVNAGKWTNPGEGEISTDFFYVITDDANWKEVILDNIPVPESKEISVILTSPNAIGEYCYFDDISLKIYSRDRVDPLLFISDLDVKDLYYEDTLSFTQYNDSTGIAKNPAFFGKYTVLANMIEPESGRVTLFTDAPGFIAISSDSDGDGKEGPSPFAVGTPMVPEDAVNQISSNALLGIAEDIDVKTTGETLFDFNLPSGYKIINPTIVVECIDSQSLNGDYQLQWIETENNNSYWGTTPAIISPGNQRAFTFYDQSYAIPTAGGIDLPMAINVNVADTGTSGTINVYLFGTLIVDSQN